jgi:prepilin-type processing-associated H-X9-DG protein
MLQYRLSTLFLIFFVVAATLALFGAWGIWIAGVLFLAALCLNRAKRLMDGVVYSLLVVFIGIVCPGLMLPAVSSAREAARCANCNGNMKQLGLGLLNFEASRKHFPSVHACDKDGKPLFSWLVAILPHLEYDLIYNKLKKDEPWDSPQNTKVLSRLRIEEFVCPSVNREDNDTSSNYVAIIGPGTIWRKEGTVKLSDLQNGSSHTIAVVETADSGKHWAEPFALTVDEVLENMRTGKGVRISSCHPGGVNVVFADSSVHTFPTKMPLSIWRQLLSGEFNRFDELEPQIDPNAPDMVDVYVGTPGPKPWAIILGVIVWLVSIVLLFHRAVKSRKKPETAS